MAGPAAPTANISKVVNASGEQSEPCPGSSWHSTATAQLVLDPTAVDIAPAVEAPKVEQQPPEAAAAADVAPGFQNRSDSQGSSGLLLQHSSMSKDDHEMVKALDADGDGRLSISEMLDGVKKQVQAEKDLKQMRRRVAGAACVVALAGAAIFGLTLTANLTAKDLWLDEGSSHIKPMITNGGALVSVAEAKVAVPLGLAPFLNDDQLQDLEIIKYHDYVSSQDVWDRVVTAMRKISSQDIESEEITPEEKYQVSFLLGSGRQLVINAANAVLETPNGVRMELCGSLQCSQLHMHPEEAKSLEDRAQAALGSSSARRLAEAVAGSCSREESNARRLAPLGGQQGQGQGERQWQCSPHALLGRQTGFNLPFAARANCQSPPESQVSRDELSSLFIDMFQELRKQSKENEVAHVIHYVLLDAIDDNLDGCATFAMPQHLQDAHFAIEDTCDSYFELRKGCNSDYEQPLSKTDCHVLAAIIAFRFLGGPELPFYIGRPDGTCIPHNTEGTVATWQNVVDKLTAVHRSRSGKTSRAPVTILSVLAMGGKKQGEQPWMNYNAETEGLDMLCDRYLCRFSHATFVNLEDYLSDQEKKAPWLSPESSMSEEDAKAFDDYLGMYGDVNQCPNLAAEARRAMFALLNPTGVPMSSPDDAGDDNCRRKERTLTASVGYTDHPQCRMSGDVGLTDLTGPGGFQPPSFGSNEGGFTSYTPGQRTSLGGFGRGRGPQGSGESSGPGSGGQQGGGQWGGFGRRR